MNKLLTIVSIFILFSCAQVVAPSGGDKDVLPPTPIEDKTLPLNYSTNFTASEISIEFDEYFKLSNPSKNVIITPVLENKPDFKIKNKKLLIKLNNTLEPNTTYTINFGESILDITEGNILKNFKYVFSTGTYLDSLEVTGNVFDAITKKPIEDAVVMLYTNFEDSIPLKEKPYYFANTKGNGSFKITNIKAGDYKLFALKEDNGNLIFDSKTELIAFSDTIISIKPMDSIKVSYKLIAFQEEEEELKILDKNYYNNNLIRLTFNKTLKGEAPIAFIPNIEVKPYVFPKTDSIQYFINENVIIEKVIINPNSELSDTIKLRQSKIKQSIHLKLDKNRINEEDTVIAKTLIPIVKLDKSKIEVLKDSVEIPFSASIIDKELLLAFSKQEDLEYQITLFPNAIEDKWGNANDTTSYNVTILKPDFYGDISLNVKLPNNNKNYIFQLLDSKGDVFKEEILTESKSIVYNKMFPGEYSAKIILDENKNGYWDTGNYLNKMHAEKIFLLSKKLTLRSNWEINETWEIPTK